MNELNKGALSIRPKIPEIPVGGANGTDIWPKIPENRNNRKIPFHSTIPARGPSFFEPGNRFEHG